METEKVSEKIEKALLGPLAFFARIVYNNPISQISTKMKGRTGI